ncbi:hypothetical protein ACFPRL_33405 [Pseudoclavibacter helvolus]
MRADPREQLTLLGELHHEGGSGPFRAVGNKRKQFVSKLDAVAEELGRVLGCRCEGPREGRAVVLPQCGRGRTVDSGELGASERFVTVGVAGFSHRGAPPRSGGTSAASRGTRRTRRRRRRCRHPQRP